MVDTLKLTRQEVVPVAKSWEKKMGILRRIVAGQAFFKLDRSIVKLKKIRDSYRSMNVEIYGEEMAKLLNDW